MCLIVDPNVFPLVFGTPPAGDFAPVRQSLEDATARLVYGGSKLAREYKLMPKLRRLLVELDRRGSARPVRDADVDRATKKVIAEGRCRSDDEHIIALARVSQVRLLCSHDKNLVRDFSDSKILHPRGDVYQRSEHAHLIRKHCQRVARSKPAKR